MLLMTDSIQTLPKVIYIMGTARSGTTVLEILLSHGENAFGAGEITSLIHDGFIENKMCSCENDFSNCTVWSNVSKTLSLSNEQLTQWELLQKKLDWHDGFLRQVFGMINNDERFEEVYSAENVIVYELI